MAITRKAPRLIRIIRKDRACLNCYANPQQIRIIRKDRALFRLYANSQLLSECFLRAGGSTDQEHHSSDRGVLRRDLEDGSDQRRAPSSCNPPSTPTTTTANPSTTDTTSWSRGSSRDW
ncbi:hypothetical protein AVEN_59842-1 [Araneus ventricosus]|uniref:Uncharacterized protein n=1 Tax=Araneus ventricosus TaxID=182803 RepID=A0A4Y2WCD5_ARAVE|nr:hypothetical protein AVEN_59842-1 [Araneus ventricosus]